MDNVLRFVVFDMDSCQSQWNQLQVMNFLSDLIPFHSFYFKTIAVSILLILLFVLFKIKNGAKEIFIFIPRPNPRPCPPAPPNTPEPPEPHLPTPPNSPEPKDSFPHSELIVPFASNLNKIPSYFNLSKIRNLDTLYGYMFFSYLFIILIYMCQIINIPSLWPFIFELLNQIGQIIKGLPSDLVSILPTDLTAGTAGREEWSCSLTEILRHPTIRLGWSVENGNVLQLEALSLPLWLSFKWSHAGVTLISLNRSAIRAKRDTIHSCTPPRASWAGATIPSAFNRWGEGVLHRQIEMVMSYIGPSVQEKVK